MSEVYKGGNKTKYHGVAEALGAVVKSEGLRGLYRGFLPHLVYVIPSASISFVCYEAIVEHYHDTELDKSRYSVIAPILGMTLARLSGSIIRTPFDIVKMRLQVDAKTMMDTVNDIIRKDGYRGLFKYSYVSIMRDLPFSAIYFSSYEILKSLQRKGHRSDQSSTNTLNHLIAGSGAGCIASIMTIPLDVVKTKLQTQDALPKSKRFSGVTTAIKSIIRDEGFFGLTKQVFLLNI
eukprot:gene1403-1619_t